MRSQCRTTGAAVAALWILDAGMNVVMAASRCIVAALGMRFQARGNAALAAAIGAGQLVGFGVGAAPLSLGWLCVGVAVAVVVGALVTASAAARYEADAATALSPSSPPPPPPTINLDSLEALRRWLAKFQVPPWMRALAGATFLSWLGWYAHIVFTTQWIASDVCGGNARAAAGTPEGEAYARGVRLASGALAAFAAATASSGAGLVPAAARLLGVPRALAGAYAALAALLFCTSLVPRDAEWAAVAIVACLGLPWAVTQSLPYAVVAAHAPAARRGALLGALNVFVTLPEVTVDLGVKPLLNAIQGKDAGDGSGAGAVLLAGAFPAALAALVALFVPDGQVGAVRREGGDDVGDDDTHEGAALLPTRQ